MRSYLKTFLTKEAAGQFVKLGVIGGINTVVYFALFNVFRSNGVGLQASITIAFAIATLVSYFLNRRWTFNVRHGWASFRETAKFFVINGVAWAVTLTVVAVADNIWGELSLLQENLANVVATAFILLPKFASYRDVVFRSALQREGRDPMGLSVPAHNGAHPDAESVASHLPQGADRDAAG